MSSRTECETEALRWVEQLIERNVTTDQLLKSAEVLSIGQYDDVIEERNIGDLCGYPLCNATLGPIPKQKYHINVAKKQIFDLTERKKFCSDACYKCSKYFGAQLSPSPLWSRTKPIMIEKVKLLPSSIQGRDVSGRQIITTCSPSVQKREADNISKQPSYSLLPSSTRAPAATFISPSGTPSHPLSNSTETSPIISGMLSSSNSAEVSASKKPSQSDTPPPLLKIKEKQLATILTPTLLSSTLNIGVLPDVNPVISPQLPKISQVTKLLNAISTWVSGYQGQFQSYIHDGVDSSYKSHDDGYDPPEISHEVAQGSHDDGYDPPEISHEVAQGSHDDGYDPPEISHEVAQGSHDEDAAPHSKDYESPHSDESHDESHDRGSESHDRGNESHAEDSQAIFLPPVDSINISRLQRNLFNSHFRRHLSSVCSSLDICFHEVLPQINNTTSKFRLNRHCITFRVAEWKIIAVLVIMISCGETIDVLSSSHVKQWLKEIKATPEDFKLMLTSFKILM